MFHKILMENWERKEQFYYFSKVAPTGYSMTVELDVTEMVRLHREKGIKFFPMYLWLATKHLNQQMQFKCAIKDGVVGYYDTLTPLYALWHEDDKTFSFQWTDFVKDFSLFYQSYEEKQEKYRDKHGVLGMEGFPPENAFTISALPWVNFKHFAVHSYEKKDYFFPSLEAGKFEERDGRIFMPLSMTCHHATTDGYHISEFLKGLQEDMLHFEKFL